VYANEQRSVNSYTTDITREVSKTVGAQPANGVYVMNKAFTLPNSYSNNNFTFKIGKYDDTNITNTPADTITIPGSGTTLWNVYPLGNDNSNSFVLNQNASSYNKEIESDWMVAKFDLSTLVPIDAVVKSIQLKLVRKSLSFNDKDLKIFPSDGDIIPNADDFLLNNNITSYTRDYKISFMDDYDYDPTVSSYEHDNMAQPFTPETVDVTSFSTGYTYAGKTLQLNNISSDLNSYVAPKGVWDGFEKETVIYGDDSSTLWGYDPTGVTSVLRSGKFAVKMKLKQKVFRGYGYDSFYNPALIKTKYGSYVTFSNIMKNLNWNAYSTTSYLRVLTEAYPYRLITPNNTLLEHYAYRNSHNYYDISLPLASYVLSRLYSVAVKVNYQLNTTGFENIYDDRSYGHFTNEIVKTNDIYFKNQKCFDGVCYQYSISLSDIYDNNTLITNRFGVNNMYNEYNLIEKYIPNSHEVDYAIQSDINTGLTYYTLDGSVMRPGNTILLTSQNISNQNDVYMINDNYALVLSDELSTKDKSNRCKFTIKYGSAKEMQFFLTPRPDDTFPVSGEPKTFTEGHSYIIKNMINYNLDNTSSYDISKVLFTDYSVARTLNSKTMNQFKPVMITLDYSNFNKFSFKYRDLEYIISDEKNNDVFCNGISIAEVFTNATGNTNVRVTQTFYILSAIGDYVEFKMYETLAYALPSNTRLTYSTTIVSKYSIGFKYYIVLGTSLSKYQIDQVMGYSTWTYTVDNLNYINKGVTFPYDFVNNFKKLPLGDIMTANELSINGTIVTLQLIPKENNFKYFNYNEIEIQQYINNTYNTTHHFGSDNQYVNYELKPFFDKIVASEFGAGVTLPLGVYNDMALSPSEYTYYTVDLTWYVTLVPSSEYKLQYFEKHTYVNVTDGVNEYKSMIKDITGGAIILTCPMVDGIVQPLTSPTITNISDFGEISDILMYVYQNYTHGWYYKMEDSQRNRICAVYAGIISRDSIVRSLSSGIIYQENDKWNYDIFNLELDGNFNNKFDVNMVYKPIEILDVGKDRITKLQKNIDIDNINIPDITPTIILTGYTINNNNTISENSYILGGATTNSGTSYIGKWNDRFKGTNFVDSFNYYDASTTNKFAMIVTVDEDFREHTFYRVFISPTGSPTGPNTLNVVSVGSVGNKLQCVCYIIPNSLGSYTFDLKIGKSTITYTKGITTVSGKPKYILFELDTTNDAVTYCITNDAPIYNYSESLDVNVFGSDNGIYKYSGDTLTLYKGISNRTFYNVNRMGDNYYSVGNNMTTNKVFVMKHDLYMNNAKEIDTNYTYNKISGLLTDGACIYMFVTDSSNISHVDKYDADLNVLWSVPIGPGSNSSYDMTQDDTDIFVCGTYTDNLYLGDTIFVDSPLGKTYSYITKISKEFGVIASATNIISTNKVTATSLINFSDHLEVAGSYIGMIYVDGVIKNSNITSYFITNIKKNIF